MLLDIYIGSPMSVSPYISCRDTGLDHGVGHTGCLCTMLYPFSTEGKEHVRTPT